MFSGRFLALLVLGHSSVAVAHIGSPNVYYAGSAGAYHLNISIRPPAVLPGAAQVDVRIMGELCTNVTLQARPFDSGNIVMQPTVQASPVAGESNFFNGEIRLLRAGAYGIDVQVEGSAGIGKLSIPLNSLVMRSPAMNGTWKAGLILAGTLLFISAILMAAAIGRDYAADATLSAKTRIGRGVAAGVIVGMVLSAGICAGTVRWRAMDRDFKNNALSKPQPVIAFAETNGNAMMLRLERLAPAGQLPRTWDVLSADHGKLMHLFLVRAEDQSVFAHLHPRRRDGQAFDGTLPALPAGNYSLYAELTYEDGFNETLVTNIELAGFRGGVPQAAWRSNDVLCQSAVMPVDAAAGDGMLDADDSWHVGAPGASTGKPFSRLMGGGSMVYNGPRELRQNRETVLRFLIFEPDGRPSHLQPYMGMLGHAVVRRKDGTVFTHLHPMGTVSMAAQSILARQEKTTESANVVAPADGDGNSVTFPYAFPRSGEYRAWIQVRVGGAVLTGVFDFTVRE